MSLHYESSVDFQNYVSDDSGGYRLPNGALTTSVNEIQNVYRSVYGSPYDTSGLNTDLNSANGPDNFQYSFTETEPHDYDYRPYQGVGFPSMEEMQEVLGDRSISSMQPAYGASLGAYTTHQEHGMHHRYQIPSSEQYSDAQPSCSSLGDHQAQGPFNGLPTLPKPISHSLYSNEPNPLSATYRYSAFPYGPRTPIKTYAERAPSGPPPIINPSRSALQKIIDLTTTQCKWGVRPCHKIIDTDKTSLGAHLTLDHCVFPDKDYNTVCEWDACKTIYGGGRFGVVSHIWKQHLRLGDVVCPVCFKKTQIDNWKKHMSIYHPEVKI